MAAAAARSGSLSESCYDFNSATVSETRWDGGLFGTPALSLNKVDQQDRSRTRFVEEPDIIEVTVMKDSYSKSFESATCFYQRITMTVCKIE